MNESSKAGAAQQGARPELTVPRPDESAPADEMAMARGWLTHLREGAIFKLEDLDDDQLRWKPAPDANSLGVVVVHLGYAERLWFRAIFAGEEMDMSWRTRMFELPDAGHIPWLDRPDVVDLIVDFLGAASG